MDYLNINLNNDHERNTDILDGYNLDTLFLEISCNLREINEETVKIYCVFYMETKLNPLHSFKYIISKKGIDKNIYKPFSKSEGLQPMYLAISTILFSFTSSVM